MDVDAAVNLDPNQVSPGLLGFLIVCVLGVLVWLLCRNMGKHLTKLDNELEDQRAAAELTADVIPAQAGPAGAKPGKSGTARNA
jgi:hypothetical protein